MFERLKSGWMVVANGITPREVYNLQPAAVHSVSTGECILRSRPPRLVPRARTSTLFGRLSPGVICVHLEIM